MAVAQEKEMGIDDIPENIFRFFPKEMFGIDPETGYLGFNIRCHVLWDYDLFTPVGDNRKVYESQIKKLTKSMQKDGFDPNFAILVKRNPDGETFGIVNGQHRFNTLKRLGLPIFFHILQEGVSHIKTMVCENTTQKAWNMQDCIRQHVNHNKHYADLEKFIKAYPDMAIQTCVNLIYGVDPITGQVPNEATSDFKGGSLEFTEEQLLRGYDVARRIDDVISYKPAAHKRIKKKALVHRALAVALQNPDVDWKVLWRRIKQQLDSNDSGLGPSFANCKSWEQGVEAVIHFINGRKTIINFAETYEKLDKKLRNKRNSI